MGAAYGRLMAPPYPPQPWHLRGQMYVSLWSLPKSRLSGRVRRPLVVAGRVLVGTAWVRYGPGGDLRYDELLSAVLIRAGARPSVTIMDIWVNSPASLAGGRALWWIPKDLAGLRFTQAGRASATGPDGTGIAAADLVRGRRLPGRLPFRFTVTQTRDGRSRPTPVRGTARIGAARSRWFPEPAGPLAYLAGRRPLLTVALTDFRLTFGAGPR